MSNLASATQMAGIYGLKSSVAFNKLMVKCGILNDTNKGYVLAADLRGRGLTAVITSPYFLPNGIKAFKKKAVWTEEGQTYVRKTLIHHGIAPVGEQKGLFD